MKTLIATLALALAGVAAAQPPTRESQPRFPQLTMDQLNEAQRPLAERVMRISSVGLGGPYNLLLRSPEYGMRQRAVAEYLRQETSVPIRLNEFAIIIVGRIWRSQVEWAAHAPLAEKAGLSPQVIADLKARRLPAGMKPDEAVVYDFTMELSNEREVSDVTFSRARAIFTDQQIVDLTAVIGMYHATAMMMAMARQGLPPGRELAFQPGEP